MIKSGRLAAEHWIPVLYGKVPTFVLFPMVPLVEFASGQIRSRQVSRGRTENVPLAGILGGRGCSSGFACWLVGLFHWS